MSEPTPRGGGGGGGAGPLSDGPAAGTLLTGHRHVGFDQGSVGGGPNASEKPSGIPRRTGPERC